MQHKESVMVARCKLKILSLGTMIVWHQSASLVILVTEFSLVMPNNDSPEWQIFQSIHRTTMIGSYSLWICWEFLFLEKKINLIIFRDMRQNKGSILKASVDYIRKLRKDQERHRHVEEKLRQAESEKRKMFLRMQVRCLRFSTMKTWKVETPKKSL